MVKLGELRVLSIPFVGFYVPGRGFTSISINPFQFPLLGSDFASILQEDYCSSFNSLCWVQCCRMEEILWNCRSFNSLCWVRLNGLNRLQRNSKLFQFPLLGSGTLYSSMLFSPSTFNSLCWVRRSFSRGFHDPLKGLSIPFVGFIITPKPITVGGKSVFQFPLLGSSPLRIGKRGFWSAFNSLCWVLRSSPLV